MRKLVSSVLLAILTSGSAVHAGINESGALESLKTEV